MTHRSISPKPVPGITFVADDMSGAADCAIAFARNGHPAVVSLNAADAAAVGGDRTLSFDTDSRRLSPLDAATRIRASLSEIKRLHHKFYKKIDSTLRGPWAAEVAALRLLFGTAIVAPAYPATGRSVVGGNVYVQGIPLQDTDTWKLEHSHLQAGLNAQLEAVGLSTALVDAEALRHDSDGLSLRIDSLVESGVHAIIIDATSEQALRTLALATCYSEREIFWVGSGGLARELASVCAPKTCAATDQAPPGGPVLVLVGSLSAASERQCVALERDVRVSVIELAPAVLRAGQRHTNWLTLQASIGAVLNAGKDLLVRIGRDDSFYASEGSLLCSAMAQLVAPHFFAAGAIIATGGETARSMLVEVGIDRLEVVSELEPGVTVAIPVDKQNRRPQWFVTKPGAFGNERSLLDAWTRLRQADSTAGR